ncbi:hypothetical protein RUND412_007501 [Rhizina undulata]
MASKDPVEVLELDPDFGSDSDYGLSAYTSGLESDLTSLISAAKNHTFENGRRYHGYKEGKYMVPNDEAEQDRMDLLHHCFLLAVHGKLIAAPVGKAWKPKRILDIGTGSGIWAIDIADQYSEAEIIGVDLSPIQPNWVPPNVKFEVDDVEEVWPYQENSFDYIHFRHLAGHIYDWPKIYRQAFKALKPGGWIEVQDIADAASCDDGSVPPSSFWPQFVNNYERAKIAAGMEHNSVATGARAALKDLGCVDVQRKVVNLPLGPWAKGRHEKELGLYWRQNCLEGVEAYALAPFTRVLGWEKKAVDEFLVKVRVDLMNPKYHQYTKFICAFGRKPE